MEAAIDLTEVDARRTVPAKYPGHVWHVDLTAVPIGSGFWVPWVPFSLPQSWPFCWWVAVAVDQFSRAALGFAVFRKRPTASKVQALLGRAIRATRRKPRHLITDKGRPFSSKSFRGWCRRRGILPRFGAVGRHGSIAIVERLIRSMKSECTRRLLVPLQLDAMRREIGLYLEWYNVHRPHQALRGRTPREVYDANATVIDRARFEPRSKWPTTRPSQYRGKLRLVVCRLEGRPHLPVISLRRAA